MKGAFIRMGGTIPAFMIGGCPQAHHRRVPVVDRAGHASRVPLPSVWNRDDVRALAARQYALVTAAQLTALGVPRSTIARPRELGGMFSWVLPGIHRVDGVLPLTEDQLDMAALLYGGPHAALTGTRALRRIGVRGTDRLAFAPHDRAHVLVPHARKRASHGFVQVERTIAMPSVRDLHGFRVVPPVRAVADACRRCTDEDAVRGLVFDVVQRSVVAREALYDEVARGQIRGSRFIRRALLEVFAGARSVPEGDVRRAFERAGVDGLVFNPRLYTAGGAFLASPDVYDATSGVCLEVDSREHHFGVASWEATMRRHAIMTAAGLAVLHVPPSRIAAEPASVVAEFEAAVLARVGWPSPRVRIRRIEDGRRAAS
jgi:hypothetical protein